MNIPADGGPHDDATQRAVDPGQELRRLRLRKGLSLAGLAERIHYTKGYLSRVENGNQALTPAVAQACDKILETGGLLDRLTAAVVPEQRRRVREGECPYRGLAAYDTADTCWFFGRERATAALVQVVTARLDGGGPTMVVAASGTGKSSLLRAGLLPALHRGALPVPGSHRWPVLVTHPGGRPVDDLLTEVSRALRADLAALRSALESSPRCLARFVHGLLGQGPWEDEARLVLVVDQLEEVFTLCQDAVERDLFIRALHALSTPDDHRTGNDDGPERRSGPAALVVLGMRADFYGACLAHPELAEALRDGQLPLQPMSPNEIRSAVAGPAEGAGLELEPGLVEVILRDLGTVAVQQNAGESVPGPGGPGVLPLLSHALLATWQERAGKRLTVEGYERTGGILGAVAATAEQAYGRLSAGRKEVARAVVLRLVQVDGDGRATRRHATLEELTLGGCGQAENVVEEFTHARLLTAGHDRITLAHEAVLRAWPRLRRWIDADTAALRAWQQLRESARQWHAEGQDPALLLRGSRLVTAQEAARHPLVAVGETERAFLLAAQAQEQGERKREQRRTRRLHQLLVALVALLVMALVSTGLAVHSSREAINGQRMARLAEKLALLGVPDIGENSEATMLLAASAWSTAPNRASRSALLSTQAKPYKGSMEGHAHRVRAVAWTGDGRHVLSGGADGTVRIWDSRSHRQVRQIDHGEAVQAVAVAQGTGRIVWGNTQGELTTLTGPGGKQALLPHRHGRRVTGLAASRDGRTVLSVSEDGTVGRHDLTRPHARPVRVDLGHPLYSVALASDGRRAAVAGGNGRLWLLDLVSDTSLELDNDGIDSIWALAFTPDGRRLVAGEWDGDISLWDIGGRKKEATFAGLTDSVVDVTVSPDGLHVAASGHEDVVAVWDLTSHRLLTTLVGHQGFVWGAEYSPDGRTLATGGDDRIVRLWTPTGTLGLLEGGEPWLDAELSPDGRHLGLAGQDGSARILNLRTGTARRLRGTDHENTSVHAVAFSDDGTRFAAADESGRVRVWRTDDPRRPPGLPIAQWRAHKRTVRSLAFRPGHRHILATGSDDHTAGLWNLADGGAERPTRLHVLDGHSDGVQDVDFLGEDTVITAGLDNTANVWDYTDARLRRRLTHGAPVLDVAAGPKGLLATTSWDDTVRLWDRGLESRPRVLAGHTGGVFTAAFDRSGTRLATAGQDNTIRVWDTYDGQLLHTLKGHRRTVRSVAFMGKDGPIVSVSEDGTIRRWSLDAQQVLRQVCRVVGDLGENRWRQQLPQVPYEPGCR
ncbi:nSTAND1 domain-containing NTPase [Streptomyces griseoloalbus]|uniref:WD40 repeat protein/transcriptional regulator with XRE-family HTH domain n=1 Tax=Streptomyces griseoloalbus TaxID=67303 RepID=A0A7W8FDD0_9ACTN|nr:helix-turn-helix domain-containing protein [Streptomyces albaduncus]MBB5130294.1 WD40 repeat protein/transcriptional regulator with XRE-family HTH domain [Streptomyces albaduncus]GGW82465.1 hypothetical protein GCM10010340_70360 [Streptomyces albaduncus]